MTLPAILRKRTDIRPCRWRLADRPYSNQTNLALKGIIGIGAMAEIANLTGNTAEATNYTKIAQDYIKSWQTLGIARDANPPHTTLNYGANNSHGELLPVPLVSNNSPAIPFLDILSKEY